MDLTLYYVGLGLSGRTVSMRWVRDSIADAESVAKLSDDQGVWMQWKATIEDVRLTVQSITGGAAWDRVNQRLIGAADALIYVVDLQWERLEANEGKRDEILDQFAKAGAVPLVIQWNKRDLPNALRLNVWGVAEFETIAPKGIGLLEAFHAALELARVHRSRQ